MKTLKPGPEKVPAFLLFTKCGKYLAGNMPYCIHLQAADDAITKEEGNDICGGRIDIGIQRTFQRG